MSNNFQNPQLISQMQMQQQSIHPQQYQNINPALNSASALGSLNSPINQNQKDLLHKSSQRQHSIPQPMPPNQSQNYNQPPIIQNNNMVRPQPHNKFFYKGNIDYPSFPTFLPFEKFGELIINACNAFNKINFEPVYVDKPKEGSIFLILIPKPDENIIDIPSDGYGWLDDEKLIKTVSIDNDKELECYERKLGFAEGHLYCSISRRRFRMRSLNYPMLEMLQYTKLREHVPVIPAQIKVQPQNIRLVAGYPPKQNQQQQMQQNQQQMQQSQQQQMQNQQQYQMQQQYKQNMNPMNKHPMQPQMQPQSYQMASRPQTPQRGKNNMYRYDDEEKNLSGEDEYDVIQSREISIGRYRRNHDYMSEILSPYNIDSIEPPEIIDINTKENLNNEVEKLNKEIEALEKEIAKKSNNNDNFIYTMNKISKCKNEEELQIITDEVNKSLDIQLVPKTDVRIVKI
ncbi:hypothetical protein BCR36DRAFT_408596 [Piromyces finnis]|uniref:Uncharacterized protein n=1 Tax=Piromyces finnis TaxID=1754191 RepID=A0A1Y1VKV5_9FUNG|nr:hypothetical protein BCR36DRAFT_408596 [Piromyces finnis]|eukprot:ORX59062.1 hypothetical protein BCR36DRAFT_408596 [Piromyces finnis]